LLILVNYNFFLSYLIEYDSFFASISYLNFSWYPSGIHPGRHVDSVAPNIIERLLFPDNPSHHFAVANSLKKIKYFCLIALQEFLVFILTNSEAEILKSVLVECLEDGHHSSGEIGQHDGVVGVVVRAARRRAGRERGGRVPAAGLQAAGGHVRVAGHFDFLHSLKLAVKEELQSN
jgi:hypothetical protein